MPPADLRARLALVAVADASINAARITAWAAGGVTALQLRDKTAPAAFVRERAKQWAALCRELGLLFIINDRADWQEIAGADGVHVGWSDQPEAARNRMGRNAVLGISAATPEQAMRAMEAGADYLGVGPIYSTGSKADAGAAIGLKGLAEIRALTPAVPIVAIGGITPEVTAMVLEAGADGVAAIAALVSPPDPMEAAEAFTRILRTRKG